MRGWILFLSLCSCATTTPIGADGLRIYLARHGQTEWNAQRRLQGATDVPLNETGRQQATLLAARLERIALDHIYTSALTRTRETAAALKGSAPATPLAALNEQSLGKFEGIYRNGQDPAAAAEFERRSADANDTLDGGESTEQHFARVQRAITELRALHPSGSILIVGHGGTNALILRALLDLTGEQAETIGQSNDELYLVETRTGATPLLWKLIGSDQLEAL